MRATKRTLWVVVLLFAFLLCSVLFVNSASFNKAKAEESKFTIVVSDEIGKPGESVDVKLTLKNNPGVASIKIKVSYGEYLTLTNVVFNSDMGGQTITSNYQEKGSPVTLSWVNAFTEYTSDSTFATLSFSVLGSAEENTYDTITITYDEDDVYNSSEENIELVVESGVVYFSNAIAGDINGDGKVNNKDITRLFQYLANWEVEVNKLALDVNGDGKVNNKDITRLFQFAANWDVEVCLTLTNVDIQKGSEVHTHEFTQQNTDSKYLKTPVSCTENEVYYYSCSCGAIGTETFTYRVMTGHYYVATYGPKDGGNVCEDGMYYAMYCTHCAKVYESITDFVSGRDVKSTTALGTYYDGVNMVAPLYVAPAANGFHTADSTWTVTTEPTLTTEGLVEGICLVCGEEKSIVLPALSNQLYVKTGAEDCTNAQAIINYTITNYHGYTGTFGVRGAYGHKLGTNTFFEALTDTVYEYSDVSALIGNGLFWSAGEPGNCQNFAYAIFTCETCSNQVAIKTKGPHTYAAGDNGTKTPATCTTNAYISKTCTACNETQVVNSNAGNALGHLYTAEVISATEIKLTCQRAGCGNTQTITPTNTEVTPATCEAKGYTTYTYVDPADGLTKTVVANYTDTVPHKLGNKTFQEALTDTVYEYSDVSALIGNGMAWSAGEPGDCTNFAYAIFTCETCSNQIAIMTKGPHTYGAGDAGTKAPATCTTNAYISKTCTTCGKTQVVNDNAGNALGHSYTAEVITATKIKLTCQRTGCTNTKIINVLNKVVTPATCEAKGYTAYTYTDPADDLTKTVVANYTDIVGHKLGTNTFFEALTDTVYEYDDVSALIGNGMVWSAGEPGDCTNFAYAIFTCETCSNQVAIKTKGPHTYGAFTNHPATCSADAYKDRVCSVCGDVDKVISQGTQLTHSYVATALDNGDIKLVCSNCQDKMTITPTKKDVTPATCVTGGYTTYTYEDPVAGTKTIVANATDPIEHDGDVELTWTVENGSDKYECKGFVCENGCGQLIVTSKVKVVD